MKTVKWLLVLLVSNWGLANSPNARFFIEDIEIVGQKTMSEEVLLAHCLLSKGIEYDEIRLSDALNRIRKLPFVYDCEFSLKKGSQRGHFVLLIKVTEVRNLTFGLHTPDLQDLLNAQREPDQFDGVLLANWRILKRGKLEAYATFGLGLRSRDTFGGAFQGIGLSYYGLTGERSFTNLEFSGQAGIDIQDALDLKSNTALENRMTLKHVQHLAGNHWLITEVFVNEWENSWSPYEQDYNSLDPAFRESKTDGFGFNLGWTYNSVDEAWIPNTGTIFSLGLDYQAADTVYTRPNTWNGTELNQDNLFFFTDWKKYVSLSTRRVLMFALGGMVGDSTYNTISGVLDSSQELHPLKKPFHDWQSYLTLDYGVKISRKRWIFNDIRLHTGVSYQAGNVASLDSNVPGLIPGFHEFQRGLFKIGFSSRNTWGIVRFNINATHYYSRDLAEFQENF